jgi:hypothetical protein
MLFLLAVFGIGCNIGLRLLAARQLLAHCHDATMTVGRSERRRGVSVFGVATVKRAAYSTLGSAASIGGGRRIIHIHSISPLRSSASIEDLLPLAVLCGAAAFYLLLSTAARRAEAE